MPDARVSPLWNPLRQNFTADRALVAKRLAHNLPQNFPVGVTIVGACPPMVTDFDFFNSLSQATKCSLAQRVEKPSFSLVGGGVLDAP